MKLLITGATGYIGQRLVRSARQQGHQVFIAGRHSASVPFDLSEPKPVHFSQTFDVVFHLAAITASNASNPEAEIKASQYLILAAAQQGARVIFVSSQASREDAPTDYGRTKWQIEQLALAANGCVVRPGQVYGGFESGLFAVLATVVRKLPTYPAFLPAPKIQPVHVDDLVDSLLSCATTSGLEASILNIGAESPISFTRFLQAIRQHWVRRIRIPVPVPVVLVRLVIYAVGANLRTKLGLERLNSLFDLKAMDTQDDLKCLGIRLRSLDSGMHRSGHRTRRELGLEGVALLHYVLGARPTQGLIRRYIRCIEQLREGQTLGLNPCYLRYPVLIHLIDSAHIKQSATGQEFVWRLNAAVVVAEASSLGALCFLGSGKPAGFIRNGLGISVAVVQEVFWRLVRALASPFVKNPFKHKQQCSEQQA